MNIESPQQPRTENGSTIQTLQEMYIEFDGIYKNILPICRTCSDHACEGYFWLLPEEELPLFNAGAQIIEINGEYGRCTFINPLDSVKPGDFEQMKPKCPLRKDGLCSVYSVRPLVCRIYPVGLLGINGKVHIILSKDCAYSRSLVDEIRNNFVDGVLGIFTRCSRELYNEIIDIYSIVDGYFKYPEGPNEYEILGEL